MGRPRVAGSQLALLGREPAYRRLFLATLGSGAGTWLALVALEVDVWQRTQSSGWIAALLIADMLPTFAIGLLVGPLVDRLSRRKLMVGADLVRFGVFAVLPFTTSASQVVALAAVAGVATGFFRPAVYAGLPNLVQDEDLAGANSLLQTTQIVSGLSVPLLLIMHVVYNRGAASLAGTDDTYTYELGNIWPDLAWEHSLLLLVVWVHGCMGIHFWLRLYGPYRRIFPLLLTLAVIIPLAALGGFAVAGSNVAAAIEIPSVLANLKLLTRWPSEAA